MSVLYSVDIRAVISFVILSLGDIPVIIFEHKKAQYCTRE